MRHFRFALASAPVATADSSQVALLWQLEGSIISWVEAYSGGRKVRKYALGWDF